jgi:hypothetical protein
MPHRRTEDVSKTFLNHFQKICSGNISEMAILEGNVSETAFLETIPKHIQKRLLVFGEASGG